MSNYSKIVEGILEKNNPISFEYRRDNSNEWCHDSEVQRAFRDASIVVTEDYPSFQGRGIVICGGGKYFPSVWVTINAIRHHGCKLPIELWYLGSEMNDYKISLLEEFNVECIDALEIEKQHPHRNLKGFELKPYSIKHSKFQEVLSLDADNSPTMDPEYLFESEQFKKHGAYFFRDKDHSPDDKNYLRLNGLSKEVCEIFGVTYKNEPSSETGQMLIDKNRCWQEVFLASWWNEFSEYTHNFTWFDKDTFLLAWRQTGKSYYMIKKHPIKGFGLQQYDHNDNLIFLHRCGDKWSLGSNKWLDRPQEELLHSFVKELRDKMKVNII